MNKGLKGNTGLSLIFAFVTFLFSLIGLFFLKGSVLLSIIWVALLFAGIMTMGIAGLELEIFIKRKHFRPVGRRHAALSLVLALAFGMFIGLFGQVLFCLDTEKYYVDDEIDTNLKEANVVFLMDCSASMGGVYGACQQATCQLLDSLDEEYSFQFMTFSVMVVDDSGMYPVNDANRKQLKDFINQTSCAMANTSFDDCLESAYQSLKANEKKNSRNVVILFSDIIGGSYNSDLKDKYKNSDIELYIMRVSQDGSTPIDINNTILELARKEFVMVPDANGQITTQELMDVLNESVKGITTIQKEKTRLIVTDELLPFSRDISISRVLIRTVFYILFAAAAAFVYYGFKPVGAYIGSVALAIPAAIVSLLLPISGFILLLILCLGSVTKYDVKQQGENDDV